MFLGLRRLTVSSQGLSTNLRWQKTRHWQAISRLATLRSCEIHQPNYFPCEPAAQRSISHFRSTSIKMAAWLPPGDAATSQSQTGDGWAHTGQGGGGWGPHRTGEEGWGGPRPSVYRQGGRIWASIGFRLAPNRAHLLGVFKIVFSSFWLI